jgi:hypothetical protein
MVRYSIFFPFKGKRQLGPNMRVKIATDSEALIANEEKCFRQARGRDFEENRPNKATFMR